jgi:hypothetical protein
VDKSLAKKFGLGFQVWLQAPSDWVAAVILNPSQWRSQSDPVGESSSTRATFYPAPSQSGLAIRWSRTVSHSETVGFSISPIWWLGTAEWSLRSRRRNGSFTLWFDA